MNYERTLRGVIERASKNFKVVMLTGMRQVGKTTLLSDMAGDGRAYITLDDARTLKMAKEDPYLLFETYKKTPLLIDEVQYAPELFSHIKMLADSSDETGLVWMTGSQQFLLMKGVSETLAGRMALIELHGFSLYETENMALQHRPFVPSSEPASVLPRRNAAETFEIIWKGSFPGLLTNPANSANSPEPDDWELFYSSYVKTYIERDVRQLSNVGDELAFYNFLRAAAARTGQELNLSALAGDAGVSVNTAKAWLSVLRASGIVCLLPPYSQNIIKRVVKRPKIYFMDTGLVSYLTDWNTGAQLMAGAMSGAVFETFVVGEILKSYNHNGKQAHLYYYRDSNKAEIDLLIARDGMLHPVEIKKTASPDSRMIKNFGVLEKQGFPASSIGYGALVCLTDKPFPLTRTAAAMSVWDM